MAKSLAQRRRELDADEDLELARRGGSPSIAQLQSAMKPQVPTKFASRFTIEDMGNRMKLTNKRNGKSHIVPLFAYRETVTAFENLL